MKRFWNKVSKMQNTAYKYRCNWKCAFSIRSPWQSRHVIYVSKSNNMHKLTYVASEIPRKCKMWWTQVPHHWHWKHQMMLIHFNGLYQIFSKDRRVRFMAPCTRYISGYLLLSWAELVFKQDEKMLTGWKTITTNPKSLINVWRMCQTKAWMQCWVCTCYLFDNLRQMRKCWPKPVYVSMWHQSCVVNRQTRFT